MIRTWIARMVRAVFCGFVITKLNNPHGLIYLTFDDGPCERTLVLANALRQMNVPASFFFNGDAAEDYKEIIEKLKLDGFYIGNHAYHHSRYAWYQWKEELANIKKGENLLSSGTGRRKIYRPPFGSVGPITFFLLFLMRYTIIHWTVDSRDFNAKSVAEIIDNLQPVQSGDIVLLHSDAELTVTHIRDIIAALSDRGCRFGDLSKALS